MTIRELTLEDSNEVNKLCMQLQIMHVKHRPDLYRDMENTAQVLDLEAYFKDTSKIMLGAEAEGKIVGFCISEIRQSEGVALVPRITVHIKNLAVDENYRRNGIGKALYYETVKIAKAQGAEAVDLKVFSFNKEAVEFYKSLGMTVQNYTMEKQI